MRQVWGAALLLLASWELAIQQARFSSQLYQFTLQKHFSLTVLFLREKDFAVR